MTTALSVWLMSDAPASRRQAVLGSGYRGLRSIIANPTALVGLVIVAVLVLLAVFAPLVAMGKSPLVQDLSGRLAAPSGEHWFGTDNAGRDILSRVLYGMRNTLLLGLIGALLGIVLSLVASAIINHSGITWIPPGRMSLAPLTIRVVGA